MGIYDDDEINQGKENMVDAMINAIENIPSEIIVKIKTDYGIKLTERDGRILLEDVISILKEIIVLVEEDEKQSVLNFFYSYFLGFKYSFEIKGE